VTVKDEDIREVINLFIQVANDTGILGDIAKSYRDNRSMGIRITDAGVRTGFMLKDGKIVPMLASDKPTVIVAIPKDIFWRIINADNPVAAKTLIYNGVFCDDTISMTPPPGMQGGALHFENLVLIFEKIMQVTAV